MSFIFTTEKHRSEYIHDYDHIKLNERIFAGKSSKIPTITPNIKVPTTIGQTNHLLTNIFSRIYTKLFYKFILRSYSTNLFYKVIPQSTSAIFKYISYF